MEGVVVILNKCSKCGVEYPPTRSRRCPHKPLKMFRLPKGK